MGAHTRSYWSGDRWPFFSAPEAEAALKIRNGNLLSEGTGEPLDDPTRGSSAAVPAPGGMTCHGPDVCWEAPLPLPI